MLDHQDFLEGKLDDKFFGGMCDWHSVGAHVVLKDSVDAMCRLVP